MRPLYIEVPPINLVQGDSSGKYVFKSFGSDFTDPNWMCTMVLRRDDIHGDVIFTRNITQEDGEFVFGLMPIDTKQLDVGAYFVVVELTNDKLFYNREILQVVLNIREEGID